MNGTSTGAADGRNRFQRWRLPWDCPGIWGIMTIGIGPVGYVAGWGFTDGMDAAFGWDGD